MGDDEGCNVELWKNECHKADRDSIIPVHNIYSRFVPSEFFVHQRHTWQLRQLIDNFICNSNLVKNR